jgi:hypothetical protein
MSKVSQLPALTGANLANGDQFLVTDVGSPNVSKSITADELAQGSQFSSRFVARSAMDRLWVSPGEFAIGNGVPDITRFYTMHVAWRFDPDAVELVVGSVYLPEHWATFHVDAYYSHSVSGGTGDVYLECAVALVGDGETLSSPDGGYVNTTDTIPAQYVVKATRVRTSATNVVGQYCGLYFGRRADNVADTFTGDMAFLGLMLTKAS